MIADGVERGEHGWKAQPSEVVGSLDCPFFFLGLGLQCKTGFFDVDFHRSMRVLPVLCVLLRRRRRRTNGPVSIDSSDRRSL